MTDLKRDDLDWRGGRHAAFVWHVDEAVEKVAREAYALFMTGIHLMLTPVRAPIVDDYLADLAAAVATVRAGVGVPSPSPAVY